jgi:TerD domain
MLCLYYALLIKSELSGHLETAAVKWVSVLDPLDLHALKNALAIKAQVTSKPPYIPNVKALDPSATLNIKSGQHTTIDTNVISELRLGLGWETNGEAIDLDAGVIMLDSNGYISDTVYFGNKNALGVSYGGDNRSGDAKVTTISSYAYIYIYVKSANHNTYRL